VPGTAGYVYADVPNRAIGYIIDVIIIGIVTFIVNMILTPLTGPTATFVPGADPNNPFAAVNVNTTAVVIQAIVGTILNGIYFVGSWITWRATPGQRILGMQVGNETDGATLTMNQAITRWVLLGAPFGIAQAFTGVSGLTALIGLAALIWLIALLVTTAQSPTKQGLHDRHAHTVVVKAARTVG
jgi:uncharacterized RDD family membrane protein YckC